MLFAVAERYRKLLTVVPDFWQSWRLPFSAICSFFLCWWKLFKTTDSYCKYTEMLFSKVIFQAVVSCWLLNLIVELSRHFTCPHLLLCWRLCWGDGTEQIFIYLNFHKSAILYLRKFKVRFVSPSAEYRIDVWALGGQVGSGSSVVAWTPIRPPHDSPPL